MRFITILLLLFCFACASTKSKKELRGIKNTRDLVQTMHARKTSNWVKSFSFIQSTYRYKPDGGIDTSLWYETIAYPDKFRIDFGAPALGNAVLYRQDSVYRYKNFRLQGAQAEVNDLLLMTGAVRVFPVDSTMARLERSGVLTTLFRKDTFMEQPCYVIGKWVAGQKKSKEIWIEENRLLLIRQLESAPDGAPLEIIFSEFTKVQDSWIEQWVTIKYDNKIVQTERYNDITVRGPNNLPEGIFEPAQFGKVHWYKAMVSPKLTFDISGIDPDGLSGTPDGKVSLDYEFCIPGDEHHAATVLAIDPSLKITKKGKGRIGCNKSQWLCIGNTHQANWRSILDQLAALDFVNQIDQTFWE
jgi:hypothetical protein